MSCGGASRFFFRFFTGWVSCGDGTSSPASAIERLTFLYFFLAGGGAWLPLGAKKSEADSVAAMLFFCMQTFASEIAVQPKTTTHYVSIVVPIWLSA